MDFTRYRRIESSDEEEHRAKVRAVEKKPTWKNFVQWAVAPDLGELDHTIMSREKDVRNGKKFSGWTNPLGWTDDGHDDDTVVL